jgi:hypothetical protein
MDYNLTIDCRQALKENTRGYVVEKVAKFFGIDLTVVNRDAQLSRYYRNKKFFSVIGTSKKLRSTLGLPVSTLRVMTFEDMVTVPNNSRFMTRDILSKITQGKNNKSEENMKAL